MAKILAACAELRCDGPDRRACGECQSCRTIADASSLDVVEMDAASNNGVDDIRELRERSPRAVAGRHKVYILDEAHMLSTQAWNAFLKTLEEPPPNTIFVLATTEANKVLPTVVDRCHRFDFGAPDRRTNRRRAPPRRRREKIEIADEAVALIARSATGSFRDALGTLEQLVTYSRHDDRRRTCWPCSASRTRTCCSARSTPSPPATSARRCSPPRGWPRAGATSGRFFGDLEAHARELLVAQHARRSARRSSRDAGARRAAGRAGPPRRRAPTSCGCSTCSPPR